MIQQTVMRFKLKRTEERMPPRSGLVLYAECNMPGSNATGNWLRRMGQRGGISGMEKVKDSIVRRVLKKDEGEGYTLIVDPTVIESGKREARMTYLGFKGYRPVVATLKEIGVVIAYEFKEGNYAIQSFLKAFEG